ncbi:MAG: Zn-dependent hydrolase [Chloroflexi bacterium]|nr:Zn-dependent hydrolase [Chloroflexota bacterium]
MVAGELSIDPAVVERYVMELAQHGAWGETGIWRPVYTPEWVAAQDLVAKWYEEAGLTVTRDAVGNVWGRLEGREGGKSIIAGSHIDSQLPGGRYDGALGVIAGLLAIKTLKEQLGQPRQTLEAVSFCEEESSRFPATNFWGSRAVTGRIAPGEAEQLRGWNPEETIADAMREIGLDPNNIGKAQRDDVDTFIELHIEQGPLLEHAGLPVGVVNTITGLRHYEVTVVGRSDHAGACPIDLRRDPMLAAAEIITAVLTTARTIGRPAVTTVGRMHVHPNFPSIIPEKVVFAVDARHPDPAAQEALFARHEATFEEVGARHGVDVTWRTTLDKPPAPCDPATVAVLQESAREANIPFVTMHSGAGHDAQVMANNCKVAMVFVQSKDGRSHTPAEYSTPAHMAAGITVLTNGLRKLAY